jgi:hypothetical protein
VAAVEVVVQTGLLLVQVAQAVEEKVLLSTKTLAS